MWQLCTDSCRLARILLFLLLTLLTTFLALHYLAHLLLDEVVGRLSVYFVYIFLKGVKFLTQTLGLFLLRLTFTYFANGILDVTVALLQEFLSLFLSLTQYFLTLLCQFLYLLLVLGDCLFQVLLALMHVLTLVLPIALVAYDVLQVFVALDIVRTNDFACLLDHLVRNARLAGYLYGERRTRLSDSKLEERSHLVSVVQHGTVGYAVVRVGVMLEVLIVSGDDAPCHALHKLIEHSLCHSAADLRLSASTKLVDEQQSAVASLLHHILHVQEVRRVSGEIVLDALLVTDVNHDVGEYSHLRTLTHWYGQTALQHILQQTYRLQAHRFTSGVRTGDDEDVTVAGQHYVERNGGLVLLFQSQPQERMACRNPVHHRLLVHFRLNGVGKVG